MKSMDMIKIVIGLTTAALVVIASAWLHIKVVEFGLAMNQRFDVIEKKLTREEKATENHDDQLDTLTKGVAEAKKEARSKPSKIVVSPRVAVVIATPVPEIELPPEPTPVERKGFLNLW